MDLSPCQKNAALLLSTDHNIFLTGQAGVGKSTFVRAFLDENPSIPILASTGRAALLVGGITFHSYFKLIPTKTKKEIEDMTIRDKNFVDRLRRTSFLIIDEISMISGETLAFAEEIARRSRAIDLPWGGIRIMVVGDFLQLPPVTPENQERDWAFTHDVWKISNFQNAPLKTIMRTTDLDFIEVLNDVRVAKKVVGQFGQNDVPKPVADFFNKKIITRAQAQDPDFIGTRLYATKNRVNGYNLAQLLKIEAPEVKIKTIYDGKPDAIKRLQNEANEIPSELILKVGALVMIKQNKMNEGYVNGTLAIVEKITDGFVYLRHATDNFEIRLARHEYQWKSGEGVVQARAFQFPIVLGWAVTIHSSQGSTMDSIITDLTRLWEPGQAYTAISRLRSGEGLHIEAWQADSIIANKTVKAFYRDMGL